VKAVTMIVSRAMWLYVTHINLHVHIVKYQLLVCEIRLSALTSIYVLSHKCWYT